MATNYMDARCVADLACVCMAGLSTDAKSARDLAFVNMLAKKISVKSVVDLAFVNTAGKNIDARIAMDLAFAHTNAENQLVNNVEVAVIATTNDEDPSARIAREGASVNMTGSGINAKNATVLFFVNTVAKSQNARFAKFPLQKGTNSMQSSVITHRKTVIQRLKTTVKQVLSRCLDQVTRRTKQATAMSPCEKRKQINKTTNMRSSS